MFFLIPGCIGPSRMLGNREPIILCKLQKIRAILSALFLGRYIKEALEPEHSYLWAMIEGKPSCDIPVFFSLWSCPCCSREVTPHMLRRKQHGHGLCLPLTTIAWPWSEVHTELSKTIPPSPTTPLVTGLPGGASPESPTESMTWWDPPNSII